MAGFAYTDEALALQRRFDTSALAAALELFVSELMDYKRPPLKKDLVKIYGISQSTLNKYYKKMFEDPGTGDHDAD